MNGLRAMVLALAVSVPLQAQALSCMAPSAQRSYQAAQALPDQYVIVAGRVTLDETLLPRSLADAPRPKPTQVPARLTGKSLTSSGFSQPFEKRITLAVGCVAVWCGGLANGEEIIGFLRRTAEGYVLRVDPCRDRVLANTSKKRREVVRCHVGGACVP